MLLKNQKARLVTINGRFENGQRVEKYQIKPGNNPAVEVPDKLCKTAFVQSLIKDGTLLVMSGAADSEQDGDSGGVDYANMSKPDLVTLCENRDIEVIKQDTVKTLSAKLTAKDAEEAAAE